MMRVSLSAVLFLVLSQTLLAAEPAKDRCVILVSVDGLAGFYLDDPRAEMPTLRRLAKEGARADGIVCSFPTVTWPNHTTLVTGVEPARHGVFSNSYLDRDSGTTVAFIPDPLFDKDQIVKVPTIYDAAHKAGLVTAGVIWPASRNARTLDWTVPDMAGDEAWPKYGTAHWLEELRAAGIPVDKHGTWVKESSGGVQRDWLYTRLAAHALQHHAPNLLLIHLVETDHVQHRVGPRSAEAYWAVSYADDRLRDLVEAVEQSPFKGKATIIVASDHGFFPIDKDIQPNVLLRKLDYITVDGGKITRKDAFCASQGGACMAYVLNKDRREEITKRLRDELPKIEGVAAVIGSEDFDKIGQAMPQQDSRTPDLWLAAEKGYNFTGGHTGENVVVARSSRGGAHGYLPDQPEMLGTLVLWGQGIQPGVRLGKVSNLDVAPTMARLLNVELPNTQGQVLGDALKSP